LTNVDEALFGRMPVYIPNLEMVFASILARCSLHASVNGDFSCHGRVIGSAAVPLLALHQDLAQTSNWCTALKCVHKKT